MGQHRPPESTLSFIWEKERQDGDTLPEEEPTDLQVNPIQQVLHRLGLRRSSFPPPPGGALGLLLFLVENVHVDEFERANFVVQQAHPGTHGWLADYINDIPFLWPRGQRE